LYIFSFFYVNVPQYIWIFRYELLFILSMSQYRICINISDIVTTSAFLIIINYINFLNYFQCQCVNIRMILIVCTSYSPLTSMFEGIHDTYSGASCKCMYLVLICVGYWICFRSEIIVFFLNGWSEIIVLPVVSMSVMRNRISCSSLSSNIKLVWLRLF
jgi:hypothetical protein